jgi:S1-C subfamily serine protease
MEVTMKRILAAVLLLLASSLASAQEDERLQRILQRIEKEIRDSHERLRGELRALLAAELQGRPAPVPAPAPRPVPPAAARPYLGITAGDLSDAERKVAGIGGGIKIDEVRGPAAKAGFRPGDILVELGGEAVTEERIGEILAKHKPGDALQAVVVRNKKRETLEVVLGGRKE